MARVIGCGQAVHLFEEVSHIHGSPQVHLHFLTDESDYKALGHGKVELCCHGCGHSVLVLYTEHGRPSDKVHIELRNSFVEKHKECVNRNYEKTCPNFRSKFEVADIRSFPIDIPIAKKVRHKPAATSRGSSSKRKNAHLRRDEVRGQAESPSSDGGAPELRTPNHSRLDS